MGFCQSEPPFDRVWIHTAIATEAVVDPKGDEASLGPEVPGGPGGECDWAKALRICTLWAKERVPAGRGWKRPKAGSCALFLSHEYRYPVHLRQIRR